MAGKITQVEGTLQTCVKRTLRRWDAWMIGLRETEDDDDVKAEVPSISEQDEGTLQVENSPANRDMSQSSSSPENQISGGPSAQQEEAECEVAADTVRDNASAATVAGGVASTSSTDVGSGQLPSEMFAAVAGSDSESDSDENLD